LGTWQSVTTLCRPNSENEKTRLKLGQIGPLKNTKKGFDRSVDRSVELGLGFCYQQSVYGGWGHWVRDAGRGTQISPESRVIAVIARDRKGKTYHGGAETRGTANQRVDQTDG